MNYVELHLGDWAQAVAHLTLAEEAVYLRLLRRYYADEKPLPADLAACQRLAGARTEGEREAVAVVLGEFFTLTDDGYRNKRADEEIAKVYAKKGKAAASAKARWNAPASENDANAMRPHSERNARQSPDTSLQTREKQKHERVPRSADRFDEFWQAYPCKKGRKDAEAAWRRKGLDADADLILADVRRRQQHDRDWLRGYIPHGSTYVNAEGWRDGLPPVPLPQPPAPMQPSRQMQAIQNLLRVNPHESNNTANLVPLDAGNGLGADVRALPPRLTGR